jgi:exodeoxyribonuclease VII small subunit
MTIPNPISDTPLERLNYEQALTELENIVNALEAGEGSLEESLALYERGQTLAQYCSALLDRAELTVRQLSGETPTPFETNDSIG